MMNEKLTEALILALEGKLEEDNKPAVEGIVVRHNGYIAEVDELNYDNPDENIVYIFASEEDYENQDYITSVSLKADNIEENIKAYIDEEFTLNESEKREIAELEDELSDKSLKGDERVDIQNDIKHIKDVADRQNRPLTESDAEDFLHLEVSKWTPADIKCKYVDLIAETGKPIIYSYVSGFDKSGVAVTETEEIDIEKLNELLSYKEAYFIMEKEDMVKVKRYDRF